MNGAADESKHNGANRSCRVPAKKNKKKLRVALRKNRRKRTRKGDLTRELAKDATDIENLPTAERVSGKSDLSRRRTVVGAETDDEGQMQLVIDETQCLPGRVMTATSSSTTATSSTNTESGRPGSTGRRSMRQPRSAKAAS